ncbi:hypothetical protein Tco_0005792 [Tanacetum coccineum]
MQMSPEQAYQSQFAYLQQQQPSQPYPPYGFQKFSNPRNTPSQFFSPQPSQPQHFSQQQAQTSETQFKVPQGKYLRDGRRTQKTTGKQPVVDLDEDDDDDMPGRRNLTRWNKNEEMLLAETWIEHSQDVNIGKDQQDDVY